MSEIEDDGVIEPTEEDLIMQAVQSYFGEIGFEIAGESGLEHVVLVSDSINGRVSGLKSVQVADEETAKRIVESMFSVTSASGFSMGSAHYEYNFTKDLPRDVIEYFAFSDKAINGRGAFADFLTDVKNVYFGNSGERRLKEIIQSMHKDETSLRPHHSDMRIFPYSTRVTLDYLFQGLGRKGKIAFPVPNWHFWELPTIREGRTGVTYFDAMNSDQLIEGFKKVAKEGKAKALTLVSPANPMMYKIDKECAKELDTIALKYDIDIIVDDVLRGVQPIGDRESIGVHFSKPYIVEGFSKRFGDEPLGDLSYIILPEDHIPIEKFRMEYSFAAMLLHSALTYSSEAAVEGLETRNRLFDQGLYENTSHARTERPSASNLTSLVHIDAPLEADYMQSALQFESNLIATAMHYFCPDKHDLPEIPNALRIAVGKVPEDRAYEAGKIFAEKINEYRRK